MAEISFKFRGTNRVGNNLRGAARDYPKVTDRVMKRWARGGRADLKSKPYPPKRPNQKYVRTGDLASRWRARRIQRGKWAIENTKKAASFVVGDKQAWMHINRWWKASDEIDDQTPKLVSNLTIELTKVIDI